MTTEKLIIDGVDHAKFDLEWAKRGGVVISIIDNPPTKRMIGKVIGDEFFESKHFCADEWISYSQEYRVITRKLNLFRMATPDECSAAGIRYIDPPMIWRDIESAPRDGSFFIATENFEVIYKSRYERGEFIFEDGIKGATIFGDPTHWMPLRLPQPKIFTK